MNRLYFVVLFVFCALQGLYATVDVNNIPFLDIDRSRLVGSIPISSDITPTGAKTYTVPITVAQGVNDMQPDLTLYYNSQQGNSVLGHGWSLSGLSSITRTPKSNYFDNVPNSIQMSLDDAFLLDGVRLIKLREENSYYLYETETGNIKVRGYIHDSAISYFDVFYPDGTSGTFGWTNNTNNDLFYPQTSATDLFGNSISYNYTNTGQHYEISSISYNGHSIEFTYQTRAYQYSFYISGRQISFGRLLNHISCKFAGNEICKYSLSYDENNERALLVQIDYQAGESSLNPLRFYYGEGNLMSLHATQIPIAGNANSYNFDKISEICIARGRISTDGKSDGMLVYPNKLAYGKVGGRFINTYDGTENIYRYMWPEQSAWTPHDIETGIGFVDILCADLSGTQRDKIIKVNNTVDRFGTNIYDRVSFSTYESSEQYLTPSYTRNYYFPVLSCDGVNCIHPKYYYTGDFNGDGRKEVMAMSVDKPNGDPTHPSICYIFDLENNSILFQENILNFKMLFLDLNNTNEANATDVANNSDKLFVMDYDGDGKSDIIHINTTGLHVYTFDIVNGAYTARQVCTYYGLTRSSLANRELHLGDVNGDGLCDIMVSPLNEVGSSPEWKVFLSKGNGQFVYTTYSICSKGNNDRSGYVVQDINNDGLSDVVMYTANGFTVYSASLTGYSPRSYQNFSVSNSVLIPFDLNTSGYQTSIISLKSNMITRYDATDMGKERMLTGMVNSLGVVERNEYATLNRYERYTQTSVPSEYRNTHFLLNEPISVVSKTTDHYDRHLIDSCNYIYKNAICNNKGLGFRGFETIWKQKHAAPLSEMAEYDPFRFCVPKRVLTMTKNIVYEYDVDVEDNKLAHIQLYSKTETDLPTQNEIYSQYEYDDYGYPTTEYVLYSDGSQDVIENTYHSEPFVGPGYNLGFLINSEKTTVYNDDTYTETFTIESYENRKPLLAMKYKNGNRVERKSYIYDDKGNILEEGIGIIASAFQMSHYTYDQYGNMLTFTNNLNKTTHYTYDNLGRLSSVLDMRNGTTQYQYDEIGREISKTNPDGTTSQTLYAWEDGFRGILYSVSKSETGTSTSASYYNAIGQEVRTAIRQLQNTTQKVDKQYDLCGRIRRVSLPYTGEVPSYWNSYSYEDDFPDEYAYDRLISYTEASGRTTAYEYEDNLVTTTEGNITRTKEYDSRGNVISVTDQAGTITFNYAADGQPISVVSPEGNTTTYSYNRYRYCSNISDPSSGTTQYSYGSAGLVTLERTGAGNISYTYDNKRRLQTRTCEGITYTYHYNTYGDLYSVIGSNGTSLSFQYDTYGRLIRETETALDGVWLQKNYTYSEGNISRINYSSHRGVIGHLDFCYDNGHQTETLWNDTVVVKQIEQFDQFGFPTEVYTGTIRRQYTYSVFGLPTSRTVATTEPNVRGIMIQRLNFDPVNGNLLQKTDFLRMKSEWFEYDDFNRLVRYGPYRASYSNEGNILEKTDVGGFEYNIANRPYALSNEQLYNGDTPSCEQHLYHTSFHRLHTMLDNERTFLYDYNCNDDRIRSTIVCDGDTIFRRYYLGGCYELDVTQEGAKERLYLDGDYYDAVAVYTKNYYRLNTDSLFYILRDYQGSITHVLTPSGNVVQELSYDAWGRLRDPNTHQVYRSYEQPDLILGRGYTGHEHISNTGLIHMNARVYDPALGRFISPDPYVQDPENSQNYNRYSYCFNNPLSYVDENGEIAWFIPALVGAAFNGLSYAITTWVTHQKWDTGKFFGSMAQGFFTSLVSIGVGQLTSGISSLTANISNNVLRGATTGFLVGATNGAVTGAVEGVLGYVNGGSKKEVAKSIAQGFVSGGVTGTLSGLSSAFLNKNKFENNLTPHEKGKLGVERSKSEYTRTGGTPIGNEVTCEVDGIRVRFDYVGSNTDGTFTFFEVKNGPYARPTKNQRIVYDLIRKGMVNGKSTVPMKTIGKNAINAHLGKTVINYRFEYIHYK